MKNLILAVLLVISTSALARDLADAVEFALPSTVTIVAVMPQTVLALHPNTSLGSGVIVSTDGKIVTAAHVIAGAKDVFVFLYNGERLIAHVAKQDNENDVALLTTSKARSTLIPATIGNPNSLRLGNEVFLIGSPLGLSATITRGIVSSIGRVLRGSITLMPMIQTDAAMNPGNSGGGLFNDSGQVVGISDQIATMPDNENAGSIGLGFVIPIDRALSLLKVSNY